MILVDWLGVTTAASHPFLPSPQARVLSNTSTLCAAWKRSPVAEKQQLDLVSLNCLEDMAAPALPWMTADCGGTRHLAEASESAG